MLIKTATYPGPSQDKLYESSYRHKHQNPFICNTCLACKHSTDPVCDAALDLICEKLKCSSLKLVSHQRLNKICQPAIHLGLIASGNSVIKSGELRDKPLRSMESLHTRWKARAYGNTSNVWLSKVCATTRTVIRRRNGRIMPQRPQHLHQGFSPILDRHER